MVPPRTVLAWVLALVATSAPAADRPAASPGPADRPPNVVFILADDLGINDLGCDGREDHRTPHLDRLAAEGTRFTCAYVAQPICSPSRAAILTGLAPARLHLTTFLPGRADAPSQKLLHPKIALQLPLEAETLAERLKQAGYATACVGKWHLGGAKFGPERQGFDFVHAGTANTKPTAEEGGKGEYDLTRQAIGFIDRNRDRPFFLYLAHNSPHIPLAARADLVAASRGAFHPTYAAMIQTLDDSVGLLLARLDELGLAGRTLVAFTSDNGGLHVLESPGTPATHNTPYRAGKGFLYEGGLRVPLIVRWPGQVPAGRVVEAPVVNTDWMPTLLELCGVEAAGQQDGVSLAGLLRGGEAPERVLYWHFPHYTNQGGRPGGAVRAGDWKLIEHYEDGRVELFNLAEDVGESRDLAAREPGRAAALQAKLAAWRAAVGAQENVPNPDFDPALHAPLYTAVDVSRLQPAGTAAETAVPLHAWRSGMNAVLSRPRRPAPP